MFPDNALSEFVLDQLAEDLASYSTPPTEPLLCDRWLARSCLQKAIRRGEIDVGQRALAALLEQDSRNVWRHLIIIALEDVGAAGMDTVARVIFAGRNQAWRMGAGGELRVGAFLVAEMAGGRHCQAACDLLLQATNSPAFGQARDDALDADMPGLVDVLCASATELVERGLATLAIGGGLHGGQRYREPATVFEVMSNRGHSSHVVATCYAAWKVTRNPMALLLPLVWQRWMQTSQVHFRNDDLLRPTEWIGTVPDYAIDQFTRVGGQVARAYMRTDPEMAALLAEAGIERALYHKALGDLLFLVEGGCVVRRGIWDAGGQLRLPHRLLPHSGRLGDWLESALDRLEANRDVIARLRKQHLLLVAPG
ncbi:MAG TPA: hypothetical protein VGO55_07670 [Allosphingosinicella sp.]|jgi:hypothetical protein|nr:hypothetical protein [Allosphingosinicella sp.]